MPETDTLVMLLDSFWDAVKYLLNTSFVIELSLALFALFLYIWKMKSTIWHDILRDSISQHVEQISARNAEINDLALNIMDQCESCIEQKKLTISDHEIDECVSAARRLFEKSHGASQPVQTGALLLYQTYNKLLVMKTSNQNRASYPKLASETPYLFLLFGASFLQKYAISVVEIPSNITIESNYIVRRGIRKYVKLRKVFTIPGINMDVDLHPVSPFVITFYDSVLRPFSPQYIGEAHREFFNMIESNTMLLVFLSLRKVYFPLTLCDEPEPMFEWDRKLHLIHFKPENRHDEYGSREVFELYYANLSKIFRFVQNYKTTDQVEKLIRDASDTYDINFTGGFIQAIPVGHEMLKIQFDAETGRMAYRKAKPFVEWEIGRKAERGIIRLALRFVWFWLLSKFALLMDKASRQFRSTREDRRGV